MVLDQYLWLMGDKMTPDSSAQSELFFSLIRTQTQTQTILFHVKNMEQCNTASYIWLSNQFFQS